MRKRAIEIVEYIEVPCHVTGSKHKIYYARDKIKCADTVGDTRHGISLSNRFPKLINLPKPNNFFVSGPSESCCGGCINLVISVDVHSYFTGIAL